VAALCPSRALPALLLSAALLLTPGPAARAADEGTAGPPAGGFTGPGAPTSDDDFQYIIEPGHETAIEAATRPLATGQDVGTGWTLEGISISRGAVKYRLTRAGAPGPIEVAVYHAGDATVPEPAVVRRDERIKIALDPAEGISAADAAQAAAPVMDRLLANSASLAGAWIRREGRGELKSPVPDDLGAPDAPGGQPPPGGLEAPPGAQPAPAGAGEAPGFFNADTIVVAAAILIGVLLVASLVPGIIRRTRKKKSA